MKAIILILVTVISTVVSFAQNYQTVNSKRIAYFENQYHTVQCIRIDSVNYWSDSIFHPFRNIRESENWCYSPYGASWIGKEILLRENGLNVFFNKGNDSIFIKTAALLNDTWVSFTLPDSIKIIATVINHDTMSFVGQLDSVKSIGFAVYDRNMNPLDYPINHMILKISKNYGFVTAFNFYLFPKNNEYSYELFEEYSLVGLSNPQFGIQNLTWFGVYDFQAGDELHILNESSSWGGYFRSLKTIKKYLDRSDFTDSIVYNYSFKQSLYVTSPDTSFYQYTYGLRKEVIRVSPEFDRLPGEPVLKDNNWLLFSYSMTNGAVLSKTEPIQTDVYWFGRDSCWQPPVIDDCLFNFEYLKGLGGPYYECDNFTSDAITKLVYYKKGEKTWGTPLIITGIQEEEISMKVNVFPNPAKDYIIVLIEDYKQSVIFEIFDLQGQNILMKKIDSGESKIEISDLKPGTYMYRIHDNSGVLIANKLIIN